MNQQLVEKLAIESGIGVTVKQVPLCENRYVMHGKELEIFVRMIVKECAKVANERFDSGFCPTGDFILEHFDIT